MSWGFSTLVTSASISKSPLSERSLIRWISMVRLTVSILRIPERWDRALICSVSAAEAYELPALESSKARHFTPATSTTTTGYTGSVVQYCRVDSIGKRDFTNRSIRRMVNLYWLSDTWSCRSEKCISLERLRKYLTLILWHSPCFALSIRSIRSIRWMVNLYWWSDKWSCLSENCITLFSWHRPRFA